MMATAQEKFGNGQVTVQTVAKNAVRVQYTEGAQQPSDLPDWLYEGRIGKGGLKNDRVKVKVDGKRQQIVIRDKGGKAVFTATCHRFHDGEATLAFTSDKDECLFGLGQFQDGYSNVRGLSRRLTQVNTQISLPMLISSKGYGILWNNYGLTEFNPCSRSVRLVKRQGAGAREEVSSVEAGRRSGQIAAYTSPEDADAVVQVGLSADIEPICNMVVKLALVELSRGTESGISSLEKELVFPAYLWVNRRERHFLRFASFANPGNRPTIMRWYGIRMQKDENCVLCGKAHDFVVEQKLLDDMGVTLDDLQAQTADLDQTLAEL